MEHRVARERLLDFILSGNRADANALLDDWIARHGSQSTLSDVLEPVLTEIGERWVAESISLAIGYLAGKIAEDTLMKAHALKASSPLTKGPVVIGNVEDDYHSLGRRLVGIFLKTAGWNVIDLGNDVTAQMFVDEALKNGARVIGVSAMMFTTAQNILKIREEIDRRGLRDHLKLAVGGAVFKIRPELVDEVGGDGTTASAVGAPDLITRLWRESDGHDLP